MREVIREAEGADYRRAVNRRSAMVNPDTPKGRLSPSEFGRFIRRSVGWTVHGVSLTVRAGSGVAAFARTQIFSKVRRGIDSVSDRVRGRGCGSQSRVGHRASIVICRLHAGAGFPEGEGVESALGFLEDLKENEKTRTRKS